MKQEVKELLAGGLNEYRSIPFWSWNNYLDEKELCRQIEDMKAAGIGGFVLHARTGLKEEYLGEKWFSCVSACLAKARELHMEAWIYDENGWPSGFVGGRLLENYQFRARFLEYAQGGFDESAYAVFKETENGYCRVEKKEPGIERYHNVYLRVSPANTDVLNPEVVDAFIAETHEKYYERYRESFGRELAGFFTDEPQYYRWATPYTHCAEAAFAQDGEDIRDGLIWLFVHDSRGYAFREKYFSVLNRLYVENFYKKLYDWCNRHNCKLTGHSVEEASLAFQMYGGAAVMPTYEYEHIPGIDWLGRDCGNELSPRQICSVASQLGTKFILSEMFGCAGFDVTPKELKSIAEYQYFNGINKMCQHLYPYSLAGRGKTDHPPVFSPQGNWFEGFKTFNDYFAKLSYVVANTQDRYDVAIIHPIRDIWAEYVRAEDGESVKEIEAEFNDLLLTLRKRGILFHFIDESILEKHGSIDGNGNLQVGKCVYDKIIVPKMRTLAANTYNVLRRFGGKLCLCGKISYIDGVRQDVRLQANITLDELLDCGQIGYFSEDGRCVLTARSGEAGEYLFIKNLSRTECGRVRLENIPSQYRAIDLETLEESDIPEQLCLRGAESVILIKSEGAHPAKVSETAEDITKNFKVTHITDNYLLMDYAQLSKDGEVYGERRPVTALFDALLREDYSGDIYVRQTFRLNDAMPLTLIMEKAEFKSVCVNGNTVSFVPDPFDVNFVKADIGGFVRKGENELLYSLRFWQHDGVRFALFDPLATESLRNCLYYDTSIENSYLRGDFIVEKDMSLSRRKGLPCVTSKLYEAGYPFFKGELTVEGNIPYAGGKNVSLQLDGRFMTAALTVNGKRADFVLDDRKNIANLLKKGENEVKIVLRSSLRNLFGPHHYLTPEPLGVSPYCFEFRGEWKDGKNAADYTDEYHSVPFGVDGLKLIKQL